MRKLDDLKVEVRRSARRKNVDLTIDRDGGVVIAVPEEMLVPDITRIIRNKQMWIYKSMGRK